METLGRVQEYRREEQFSEKSQSLLEKIRNVRQFVTRWQDYLANLSAGNFQKAISNLQNASEQNQADLIPRSEILARIEGLAKSPQSGTVQKEEDPAASLREIIDATRSLDAIPSALNALAELRHRQGTSNHWNDPIAALKNELTGLLQTYREYQAGLSSQLGFRPNQSSPQTPEAYSLAVRSRDDPGLPASQALALTPRKG